MARTVNTASDLNGESSAISKAGKYHVAVVRSADGSSTKGNTFGGVSAVLAVLEGDQKEKEFHLHLFDPDMSKSESSQEWANKKQTAYAIAIGQLDPSQLGEEAEIEFVCDGMQLVIDLEMSEDEKGKPRLELSYANLYHVDDPRVAKVPKNADALKLIPAELRKKPEWFSPLVKKKVPAVAPKMTEEQLSDL